MKKIISLLITIFVSIISFSQGIDTVINTGFYKSYFDIDIKEIDFDLIVDIKKH